ncbi:MAG: hypothetical protein ACI9XZ_001680 [Alphaproteobacteria bacterium]|jgi:hypothetical protein
MLELVSSMLTRLDLSQCVSMPAVVGANDWVAQSDTILPLSQAADSIASMSITRHSAGNWLG